jgi:hypothetical protein
VVLTEKTTLKTQAKNKKINKSMTDQFHMRSKQKALNKVQTNVAPDFNRSVFLYMEMLQNITEKRGFPRHYEGAILAALTGYPELKNTKIQFKTDTSHPVPYGTTPDFLSYFLPASKRSYTITILEQAKGPEEKALFHNLPAECQTAVIAHELGHVVQFSRRSLPAMWMTVIMFVFPFFKKKMERGADKLAIHHGFGDELLKQCLFLRAIPGYIQQRPAVVKNYLSPSEIRTEIQSLQQKA